MKNKKIIILVGVLVLLILIIAIFVFLYQDYKLKQNTIDKRISRYIANNCPDIKKCKVDISNFADFNWDTVCFVDSGATLTDNPSIIPAPLPKKYSFNNPKIIFLLKNEIVLFEEIPITIESIPNGTVTFDTSPHCYTDKKEVLFSVEKNEDGSGGGYYFLKNSTASGN